MSRVQDRDVSNVSFGSNLLIKLDWVKILKSQFDDFEDQLRRNEKTVYDEKIPVFMVEMIPRLWKLWVDHPMMRKVIDREIFHDLYQDMSTFFEAEASGSSAPVPPTSVGGSGQCASADDVLLDKTASSEPPPNNPKRALPEEEDSKVDNKKRALAEIDVQMSPKIFSRPVSELSTSNSNAHGSGNDLSAGVENESSRPVEVPATGAESGFVECELCDRMIGRQSIDAHKRSVAHLRRQELMNECLVYLERDKAVIRLLDKRWVMFKCSVCNIERAGANHLTQHCKSNLHLYNMKEWAPSSHD